MRYIVPPHFARWRTHKKGRALSIGVPPLKTRAKNFQDKILFDNAMQERRS